MIARLTTFESQFKTQTKINDKLQAENVELKAGRAKQEKDLFEVRGTCAELNDRCDVLEDKYDAVKAVNDQLKCRVDELEANQSSPSTFPLQPPPP